MLFSLSTAQYPDRIILSTWRYPISDETRYSGEFPYIQPARAESPIWKTTKGVSKGALFIMQTYKGI
jgi:hypothetical protein